MTNQNVNDNQKANSVITLLLCKITPDPNTNYFDEYTKLYNGADNGVECSKPIGRYITLGGFDAVSIYKLDKTNSAQWLEKVLEDKKEIIKKISPTVTYHPVHLVGANPFPLPKNKILFITFVYGVNEDEDFKEWTGRCLSQEGSQVFIYHCVNISERVIFTFSNDIKKTLTRINSIESDGIARKVYTTVNFLLPLENSTNAVMECEVQPDENSINTKSLCVGIRGSIKNHPVWDAMVKELCKTLRTTPQEVVYYNYGEDDFVLETNVPSKLLKALLEFLKNKNTQITQACWEIHTELQLKYYSKSLACCKPSDIVSILHSVNTDILDKLQYIEADKHPWYYSLRELTVTLGNIDRHPLLNGPAYVLYDSLYVLSTYLSAYNDDSIPDLEHGYIKVKDIICYSEESISRYVRCLSRLADQLIRTDDVIFKGLGKEPAIATTLPEHLLEFYHGFLRNLADYLLDIDHAYGYIKDRKEYRYGFLLSPELNQRVRLSQLLQLSPSYSMMPSIHRSWPMIQAYIIQLPAEDVFRPKNCFIPLAHECFHIFGDKLRFRYQRFNYMAMFVSATLLATWGKDSKENIDLFWLIYKILVKGGAKYQNEELYMVTAKGLLEKNLNYLLSDRGMEALQYELQNNTVSSPQTVTTRDRATKTRKGYINIDNLQPDKIKGSYHIDDCAYYFKECYADIMAITTFNVTPAEYLSMFEDELRLFKYSTDVEYAPDTIAQIVGICQRIAIVLATMKQTNTSTSTKADLDKVLSFSKSQTNIFDQVHLYKEDENKIPIYSMRNVIKRCYKSLVENEEPLQTENGENKLYGKASVSALSYVVEYLCKVIDFYTKSEKINTLPLSQSRSEQTWKGYLSTVFEDVIRNEKFFEESFKIVVAENRRRIRNDIDTKQCILNNAKTIENT